MFVRSRVYTLGAALVGRTAIATNRDVNYVEEKGDGCKVHGHRRNHTISERLIGTPMLAAVKTA